MSKFTLINKFFEIDYTKDLGDEIFRVLHEIFQYDYCAIYFLNPKKLVYSTGLPNKSCQIVCDLNFKHTKFGQIIIEGDNFSEEDYKLFATCGCIISNLIKDNELSKIMKLQVEALQKGYLDVKAAEETRSRFISHFSHELRTPLNSILGYTELLGNEFVGKLNEKQKEYINNIKVSSLNLLGMVNEILEMSKIEANSIQLNICEFEINKLVNEVENIMKPLFIEKNIKFLKNIENYKMIADYQKIQEVLFNLLSNSVKYTLEHGIVSVETYSSNGDFYISVKDNGIGIDKKYHEKIFEEFEQIESDRPNSTGLGLTITKELVKLHKGDIKVVSRKGYGTNFIVRIPKVANS